MTNIDVRTISCDCGTAVYIDGEFVTEVDCGQFDVEEVLSLVGIYVQEQLDFSDLEDYVEYPDTWKEVEELKKK